MACKEDPELSKYEFTIFKTTNDNIVFEISKKEDFYKNKSFLLGSPQHAKWYFMRMFYKALRSIDIVTEERDDKEMYAETIMDTVDRLKDLLSIVEEIGEDDNLTFYITQQAKQLKNSLIKKLDQMGDDE